MKLRLIFLLKRKHNSIMNNIKESYSYFQSLINILHTF